MAEGFVPTSARATDGLVMIPLKFEREAPLAQSGEPQKKGTHGITLPREHYSGARIQWHENRLGGAGELGTRTGFLRRYLPHSRVRTGEAFHAPDLQAVLFACFSENSGGFFVHRVTSRGTEYRFRVSETVCKGTPGSPDLRIGAWRQPGPTRSSHAGRHSG
jgi:hypothetical protein